MRCGVCGVDNREWARFCDGCGARLEATPAVRETRRTVTAVFVDVVGSTTLGDRFDPGEVHRRRGLRAGPMPSSAMRRGPSRQCSG